ncbi:MAG: hypothetical protein JST71_01655 [Bacteroidetes bacterium]|nr:hypothetical protein [Bacteroidota bacterium]MBX7238819.1 hypothetical protein [Bacteroidia bacterium]MCC7514013.1 hypothetical protein [Bacteroidia bacterium]MCW5920522.1 hypothetical protein [Bacteroidota bacterium]HCI57194.1 hypothetical protein [Bacteroidota bacterium]
MSNKRRIFLIVISITIGMGLSVIIFLMKNKGKALSEMDYLWLGTNLFFSLLIVGGIGLYFMKKKDNDLRK